MILFRINVLFVLLFFSRLAYSQTIVSHNKDNKYILGTWELKSSTSSDEVVLERKNAGQKRSGALLVFSNDGFVKLIPMVYRGRCGNTGSGRISRTTWSIVMEERLLITRIPIVGNQKTYRIEKIDSERMILGTNTEK